MSRSTLGVLPLICRHALDGTRLAAARGGQQVLQGFALAPAAFLRCRHETGLEPTHVVMGGRPGDGVPASLGVGGGTSRRMVSGVTRLAVSAVIGCPSSRCAKRSRDARPDGSRLAVARDHVAWRLNPSPPRDRVAFASSLLLSPQPLRLPLRFAFPGGEPTELTTFRLRPWLGETPPIRRRPSCLRQGGPGPPAPATDLWGQASQHLWLVVSHGVYQRFTPVGPTSRPRSRTA